VRAALNRSFYARPTVEVARDLLGKILIHGEKSGRIVETEAYLGTDDDAAHSAPGPTPRNRVIFGPPGHVYVYLIYGMHVCLNLVAEPEGVAGCVLIRALEPLAARASARSLGFSQGTEIRNLTNGPGKLTRALGITLRHYGADATKGPITVHPDPSGEQIEIGVSPRIGITKSAHLPLRFFVKRSQFLSRK
jgi:DNA-3-methyladenine glycosylase